MKQELSAYCLQMGDFHMPALCAVCKAREERDAHLALVAAEEARDAAERLAQWRRDHPEEAAAEEEQEQDQSPSWMDNQTMLAVTVRPRVSQHGGPTIGDDETG